MPKSVRPIRVDGRVYHLTLEPDTNGVLIVGCRELPGCRRPPRATPRLCGKDPAIEAHLDGDPFTIHSANLPNVQAIGDRRHSFSQVRCHQVAPVGTGVPTI